MTCVYYFTIMAYLLIRWVGLIFAENLEHFENVVACIKYNNILN